MPLGFHTPSFGSRNFRAQASRGYIFIQESNEDATRVNKKKGGGNMTLSNDSCPWSRLRKIVERVEWKGERNKRRRMSDCGDGLEDGGIKSLETRRGKGKKKDEISKSGEWTTRGA